MFNKKILKILSFLIAANILSHIFYFHYELESKTLCEKGDAFFIESSTEYEDCYAIELAGDFINERDGASCIDYSLDNHVQEDIAKKNDFRQILPYYNIDFVEQTTNYKYSYPSASLIIINNILSEYKTISLLI